MSPNVLREDTSYHKVVAVGPHFVVKHGRGVQEREGQTLLFLAEQHLVMSVVVPKLYAMYRMPSTGDLVLIMERLPGETLETLWAALKEDEKSLICGKLREAFTTIRKIPSYGFYGSVGRGLVPHHLFHSAEADSSICGPFYAETDLNAAFSKKLEQIWTENGAYSFKADFYARQLDKALKDHEPVFSHSDLQRKNILVRRQEDQAGPVCDQFDIAIVDWEEAGWYPSYWEYCCVFVAFEWRDDWPMRLEQIVDPYPGEAAVVKMLYQDLFY